MLKPQAACKRKNTEVLCSRNFHWTKTSPSPATLKIPPNDAVKVANIFYIIINIGQKVCGIKSSPMTAGSKNRWNFQLYARSCRPEKLFISHKECTTAFINVWSLQNLHNRVADIDDITAHPCIEGLGTCSIAYLTYIPHSETIQFLANDFMAEVYWATNY